MIAGLLSALIFNSSLIREERKWNMKLLEVKILKQMILTGRDSPDKAITINELITLLPEQTKKSYTTTWRHIQKLIKKGYVTYGYQDGLSDMFYLTQEGKRFFETQYKQF